MERTLLSAAFALDVVPGRCCSCLLIGKLTKKHVPRAPPPASCPRCSSERQPCGHDSPAPTRVDSRGRLPRPLSASRIEEGGLVVVVFVPVAVGAPPVLVFIPPAMLLAPATLPRFLQFVTLVTCLVAVASMFLDRLMEFMFRVRDPTLTVVDVFGMNSGRCAEEKDCGQDRAGNERRCCACKLLSTNHKLSLTCHLRMSGLRPCSPLPQIEHSHITVFIPYAAVQNCSDPGTRIPVPETIGAPRSALRMWSGHSCPLPLRLVLFFVLIAQF